MLAWFAESFPSFQEDGGCEAWYKRPVEACGEGERLLACGAAAVADLRAAVQAELGFSCSAGEDGLLALCIPDQVVCHIKFKYLPKSSYPRHCLMHYNVKHKLNWMMGEKLSPHHHMQQSCQQGGWI